jgi:hypothetical protein
MGTATPAMETGVWRGVHSRILYLEGINLGSFAGSILALLK